MQNDKDRFQAGNNDLPLASGDGQLRGESGRIQYHHHRMDGHHLQRSADVLHFSKAGSPFPRDHQPD